MPAKVEFLNLAKITKLLDGWYEEESDRRERQMLWTQPQIAYRRPEPTEESKARVLGWRKLSAQIDAGVGPSQAMDDLQAETKDHT